MLSVWTSLKTFWLPKSKRGGGGGGGGGGTDKSNHEIPILFCKLSMTCFQLGALRINRKNFSE